MNIMKRLKIGLFIVLNLLSTWAIALAPPIQVTVDESWQKADPRDVKAVLDSTVTAIAPYIGPRTLDPVLVRNDTKGPVSLYDRGPQQEYIVLLDVQGMYWAQLGYQFSHELCHLFSNYDLAPNNITHQQWFEESLCEAFSLFAVERMAEQWQDNPPYAHWKTFAPELKKYADNMSKEKHRSFAPNLSDWYQQQRKTLEENPYAQERRLNEKMASHLLQVFAKQPETWAAINYMNLGTETDDRSLAKYLNDWLQATPESLRAPIREIQGLVGVQE